MALSLSLSEWPGGALRTLSWSGIGLGYAVDQDDYPSGCEAGGDEGEVNLSPHTDTIQCGWGVSVRLQQRAISSTMACGASQWCAAVGGLCASVGHIQRTHRPSQKSTGEPSDHHVECTISKGYLSIRMSESLRGEVMVARRRTRWALQTLHRTLPMPSILAFSRPTSSISCTWAGRSSRQQRTPPHVIGLMVEL
jgi:hypothetical protein